MERRIVLHFLNNSVSVWMMSRPAWTSWLSCVACVRFTGMEASCEPASYTSRYQTFWALRRSWYPTPGVQRPEAQTGIRCAWPRGRLRRFQQSVFLSLCHKFWWLLLFDSHRNQQIGHMVMLGSRYLCKNSITFWKCASRATHKCTPLSLPRFTTGDDRHRSGAKEERLLRDTYSFCCFVECRMQEKCHFSQVWTSF